MKHRNPLKLQLAKQLLIENKSYSTINTDLIKVFGSGLSNSALSKLKREIGLPMLGLNGKK